MDSHPIPQDVTSFQFHLIGDMTLKQFTYLAIGVGIAYLTFVFLSTPYPFLAWPIISLSSALGVAFAFLPLAERPLDYWVSAYFKVIFSPTQRKWAAASFGVNDPQFKNRLAAYLSNLNHTPTPVALKTVINPLTLPPETIQENKPAEKAPTLVIPFLVPQKRENLKEFVQSAKEAQSLQSRIIQTEHELAALKGQVKIPGADNENSAKKFQEVVKDLQGLTKEANKISEKLVRSAPTVNSPAPLQPRKVQVVEPLKDARAPISLTTTPNIINGIVTDSNNNYIDGVIVVAHNQEGLPVRALKTNKLGQFIAATPLPNGTYTITLEKESLNFDVLKIELDSSVLEPIRIAAKRSL